jgi:hypothetical protein
MPALPRRRQSDPPAPLSSRTALLPATRLREYVPKSFLSHTYGSNHAFIEINRLQYSTKAIQTALRIDERSPFRGSPCGLCDI